LRFGSACSCRGIHGELDLVLRQRRQCEVYPLRLAHDEGFAPDHVPEPDCGGGAGAGCLVMFDGRGNGSMRHLQVAHTRQNSGAIHHMVGEKWLGTGQLRAEALRLQRRGIGMQQRMQDVHWRRG
jgi:hypothetical protein